MTITSLSQWATACGSAFLLLTLATVEPASAQAQVCNIGSRLELFVDEYLIESMDGVNLVLHSPQRREVVIKFNQPWEVVSGALSLFPDGDIYRLYAVGFRLASENPRVWGTRVTCYYESRDGIHWRRPNLGLYKDEDTGTTNNNIVLWPTPEWRHATDNLAVFRDTNPSCPSEARYKAVGRTIRQELGSEESAEGFASALAGNLAFQSPDGIHWSLMRKGPTVVGNGFDSLNIAFWDSVAGCYREYHREFRAGYRDIMTSTSQDFLHWSKPQYLDYGGAPQEHLYNSLVTSYFRAPHIYLGFPMRLVGGRPTGQNDMESEVTDAVFMSSRDGLRFDRSFMEAWIRPGLDALNWRHGSNCPAWGIVQTGPEELSVYWMEREAHPGVASQLRRGVLRLDGFVSVRAGYEGWSEFTTRSLIFTGRELVVNFSTSAVGAVRVEIQDASGKPIPGFANEDATYIYGDAIEQVVKWQSGSDVSALAGQPVRLRFIMRDADLYAIRFRN